MQQAIEADAENRKIGLAPEMANLCYTCGTCDSVCRLTGLVPGWNPRKAIRALALGLEQEVIDSKWPWVCTLCGRCEYLCPQGIHLLKTFRACRTMRGRDMVPGPLHKGTMMNRERGNNLGIPKDDMLYLLAKLGVEMEEDEEHPCPGFYVPVDKVGANIIVTVNSKEPFAEPDDLKFWWRIFYAAEESWTISSTNWEGVNWGLFSGDDESMKMQVERILENARRLKVNTILYPE
ncbi:MAG: MerR family transcriptional regulator [Nitrospira bacterium SG8_3]|jgi:ferredoxin|nr:MAG: MerR family transcriptional regulator [Nitrospira bacterium SG8_3]